MNRLLAAALAVLSLLLAPLAPALAAPVPYINSPMDTPQALVNSLVSTINTGFPESAYTVACTGTTTSTCNGLRTLVSITGLSTADAGAVSAVMTVTNSSVTAASQVWCQVLNYGGTGVPTDVNVNAAAGDFTFQIQNTSATAALNATVVSECWVQN